MTYDRKAAVKRLRLLALAQKGDIETFRSKIENAFASPILPNKVEGEKRELGGVACEVLSPELYSKRRVILYIHGGSFAGGSAASYRGFCARLAHKTLCRVVVPNFRLAPNAFPVSIKDVQNTFCSLFAEEQVALSLDGAAKPEIVVAADGSGASIAVSLLTTLKPKYRECVPHAIFLSPWLDISDESEVLKSKSRDEVITSEGIRRAAQMYATAENRNSALCSLPYCAPDALSTMPSLFIQMGEKEILLEDAKKARDFIISGGGKCTLDVWPGMMHLFQLSDDLVEECHLAIDKIASAVRVGDETHAGERYVNQPPLESSI